MYLVRSESRLIRSKSAIGFKEASTKEYVIYDTWSHRLLYALSFVKLRQCDSYPTKDWSRCWRQIRDPISRLGGSEPLSKLVSWCSRPIRPQGQDHKLASFPMKCRAWETDPAYSWDCLLLTENGKLSLLNIIKEHKHGEHKQTNIHLEDSVEGSKLTS